MDGRLTEHLHRDSDRSAPDVLDDWARELAKHLAPAARTLPHIDVQTILGRYHLDLLVELGSFRVGFTCEADASRSAFAALWNDAALIGCRAASVIYRLRPIDLMHHLEDCLYVVNRCDPRLFNQRGRIHLGRLASDTIQRQRLPQEELVVDYPRLTDDDLDADPSGDPADVSLEPRPAVTESTLHLLRRDRTHLLELYECARRSGARTPEQAMQRFAAEYLHDPDDGEPEGDV